MRPAIQAAQAKAEQALAAIKGGMDFNAAAIRYSDAPDALDGGDLGWRRMDEIPAAFADTIESMKPGDVSPALRGPTGFHILKLIGQRQSSRKMVTEFHARQILIKPSELVDASPGRTEGKGSLQPHRQQARGLRHAGEGKFQGRHHGQYRRRHGLVPAGCLGNHHRRPAERS